MHDLNSFDALAKASLPVAGDDWAKPAKPWLCRLTDFSLLRVSGKDASQFLNAQLSNDLGRVSRETSQFSSYCNPKGRMLCTFRIFMHNDSYCLRTARNVSDTVTRRLRLFVLRSQVTLEEDAELASIALLGENSGELLKNAGLPVPASESGVATDGNCVVILTPGVCERYEIHVPHGERAKLWDALSSGAAVVPGGAWCLHDIFSGIPNVYQETSELLLPQMANLDLVDGVSFSKGCYPGQEVIARTHHLGKLKRRMYRFVSKAEAMPTEPGTAVFSTACSSEQPSGEVVDACRLPDGTVHGLASLRIQGAAQGEIRLASPDGDIAHIGALPQIDRPAAG